MQKLGNTMKVTALGLVLYGGVGCVQHGIREETPEEFPKKTYNITNRTEIGKPRIVTHQNTKYQDERIVLNGEDLYIRKNDHWQEDEEDFYFVRFKEHFRERENEKGTADISSKNIFIPKKEKKAGTFTKKATYVKDGKFAKKAEITHYPIENLENNVIAETEEDTKFNLPSRDINGRHFYTPIVIEDPPTPNHLGFYLIEKDFAKERTYHNGTIEVITNEGIFIPIQIERSIYEMRQKKEKPERSAIPASTIGAAQTSS